MTQSGHRNGGDPDEERLLRLGRDDREVLELVLVVLDLFAEVERGGVELALALVERGPGRGRGELGL